MFLGEKGPFISAVATCTPSSSQAQGQWERSGAGPSAGDVPASGASAGGWNTSRIQDFFLKACGWLPLAGRVKSDHLADAAAAAGKGAAGLRDRGLPPCGAQLA